MELKQTYFFDTYALIALLEGNKNYEEYTVCNIVTTKMNLMELYYFLLRTKTKVIADKIYDTFREFCTEVSDIVIQQAMHFKLSKKFKKLSYIDCVGYVIAISSGMKFLTGDKEFENFPNVEFIK